MNNKSRIIELKNKPCIVASAASVGKTESEGPLKNSFDIIFPDDGINQTSWEAAESELLYSSVERCMEKASITEDMLDVIFSGDLINQCTSSTYAVRGMDVPFACLFGACSTMAYSLAMAGVFVDALASAVSHFCSAEKQFRYPLEYGSQRPPCAQRTVTGSGAFIVGKNIKGKIFIPRVQLGKIVDLGINDTSNMGAAMAPAAADSICRFLQGTNTAPADYDLIITGDLGRVGSELLIDFLKTRKNIDISAVHNDCGLMIYDIVKQQVDSGGSGCGCSAAVMSSHIMRLMRENKLKKVLFAGTGALMSPLVSLQGETIPAICHIAELNAAEV